MNEPSTPTPDEIRAARKLAGLTQARAAETILHAKRSWQNWEEGQRTMHPALFDYFLIKTKQRKP